ncbi:MAG: hypothetical protein R3E21_13695 [Caenibius sp.]
MYWGGRDDSRRATQNEHVDWPGRHPTVEIPASMTARRSANRLDRRGAIIRLSSLSLAAVVLSRSAGGHAQTAAAFHPPAQPMIFTRRLRRDLGPGQSIEAVRSFEVRFSPNAQGFRLDGHEVAVNVTAPPALAKLAEIERNRVETRVFPLQLDSTGRIIAGPGGQTPSPSLSVAVDQALEQIATSRMGQADQINAQEFMLGLQLVASSLTSNLPGSLFRGIAEQERVERQLPLPDGSFGELAVRITASAAPDTRMFQHGERTVITRIGSSERKWVEEWSLTPRTPSGR